MDEIIQRLGQALDSTKKEKGRLADELGVTPQTLRNWTSGENFPNKNRWEKIEQVTKVPLTWIFLGDVTDRAQNGLESQLLMFYRGAEERDQENLLSTANALYVKANPGDGRADPYKKGEERRVVQVDFRGTDRRHDEHAMTLHETGKPYGDKRQPAKKRPNRKKPK